MPLVSPPHPLGSDFISSRQLQLAPSASLVFCFLDPGHFQCTVAFSALVQRNNSRLCLGINISQSSPPPRLSLNSAPSVLQSNSESQSSKLRGVLRILSRGCLRQQGMKHLSTSCHPTLCFIVLACASDNHLPKTFLQLSSFLRVYIQGKPNKDWHPSSSHIFWLWLKSNIRSYEDHFADRTDLFQDAGQCG